MVAKQAKARPLTDLEKRFATLYLENFNATDAYTRASPRKVRRGTAEVNGYKLLQRPEIREFVRAQRDKLMATAELSVADTLTKLRQLLMYDPRKLYGADGRPLKITELDDDTAAAIVGIKVVTKGNADMGFGEVTEFKLTDKGAILDKAMKYHGLFDADNKQRTDPLTEVLKHIYGSGSRLTPKP